jgi:hypothetical protein
LENKNKKGFEIKDLIWIILTLRVISIPILKNYDCPYLSLNGIKWILKKDSPRRTNFIRNDYWGMGYGENAKHLRIKPHSVVIPNL